MGSIKRLSQETINRIAAGEVVVRPSAAVKELIENSIDAHSSTIKVVTKGGGMKMLQIADDGDGIKKEDFELLCERFATSKLSTFEELNSGKIATFGFRGEALASISHVAHLTVTSMTASTSCAYKASFSDGKLVPLKPGDKAEPRPAAGVKGTVIVVEDMFYNMPTRKNAFRSENEEHKQIVDVIGRYALAYPKVGWSVKRSGSTAALGQADLTTPFNSTTLKNIANIYGADVSKELLEVKRDLPVKGVKAEGYISNANWSSNKPHVTIFINGRLVDCTPVRKAMEMVYVQYLPKNRKPFLFLHLTMPGESVDVNVHPSKKEVRFLNETEILDALQVMVEDVLAGANSSRVFYSAPTDPAKLIQGTSNSAKSSRTNEQPKPSSSANGNGVENETKKKNSYINPSKLVRTDASNPAGSMERFVRQSATASTTSAVRAEARFQHDRATATERKKRKLAASIKPKIKLTSIQNLVEECREECSEALVEFGKNLVLVGFVDKGLALVQFSTGLYGLNTTRWSEELIYQRCLLHFAYMPRIKLDPPLSIERLLGCTVGLSKRRENSLSVDDSMSEEERRSQSIVVKARDILLEKAEMLNEYFSITINSNARLTGLPELLPGYIGRKEYLPQFLLRLALQVDWEDEKECFRCICRELAEWGRVHCDVADGNGSQQKPSTPQEDIVPDSDPSQTPTLSERHSEERDACYEVDVKKVIERAKEKPVDLAGQQQEEELIIIRDCFLNEFRYDFLPPKQLATDGSLVQLASTERLYRIFERC